MKPVFTHMCVSGGGFSGFLYLGVFRYLKQEKLDKSIINIAGVSVGAILGIVFALDLPLDEVEANLKEIYSIDNPDRIEIDLPDAMNNIIHHKGIFEPNVLIKKLEDIYLGNMTFLDLSKKTGKNLIVIATHLETMKPVYFSVDNTPNVMVRDALEASACVPLISKPKQIGKDYYIDGGCACNTVPVIFDNVPKDNILLLHLTTFSHLNSKLMHDNIIYYLSSFFLTFLNNNTLIHILEKDYKYYIKYTRMAIEMFPMSIIDNKLVFSVKKEEVDKSIEYGYEDTHLFLRSCIALDE